MATFDIKELAAKAHFDYVGPAFPLWWQNNKTKLVLPSLKNIGIKLGQKYFTTLTLSYNGKQFKFPNEPLISLSLSKTIVETATVGKYRKGMVKEYICTEDYQISIRGVCLDEDDLDSYPSDQVDTLKKMFEINDALEVVSNPFLELFEVRKLILKDIVWDDMAGYQGVQKYTITAVSDQDFYADLKEKDRTNFLTT
ncbi:DUF6046 domain-containing protein [Flavobacterium sp. DG1-102-2]|uniref:DUF6046 domain-containing protein n=1 Tax=Flavobacterium sp. DG1-102-2 TaxID=3081663 RepID=UPI0029494D97|nr:DUF6046 domain-containing protein [Flavobacterium sp. DG1-102-2]MDV6170236.1 DUF6046 domain-containing protein [Flavobacterium sp. DG1-102-2]